MLNSLLLLFAAQTPIIQIGYPTSLDPAYAQFKGLDRAKVYAPAMGRTWITAYKNQPAFKPGKFVLASDEIMPNPDGWPYAPQGELIEIKTWVQTSAGTRKGYFPPGQQLLTAWRGKTAWLIQPPIQTGGSITVTQPTRISCVDDVDVFVGPAAAGWNAPSFLDLNFCRNVRIWGMGWVGAPVDVSPGMGYLARLQHSTLVNAQGLKGDGVRHGFEAFGGAHMFCGSMEIKNPKGTVFGGHGMGAVALSASGIKGGGGDIAIGNKGAYGDEAEVWMAEGVKMFWLHGASSAKVYDSKFLGPLGFTRNGYGEPVSLYAERCTFTAFSDRAAVHYEGAGPFAVVPNLVDCVLK